jgi:transketolase
MHDGEDVVIFANGMMLSSALAAAQTLEDAGVSVGVVNVPVIKPLDRTTIIAAATRARAVVTAENHSVIGGLGSAVAEVMAEEGLASRLRRVGLADTFAQGAQSAAWLFKKYGLSTQDVVDASWAVMRRAAPAPLAPVLVTPLGEYAPV